MSQNQADSDQKMYETIMYVLKAISLKNQELVINHGIHI